MNGRLPLTVVVHVYDRGREGRGNGGYTLASLRPPIYNILRKFRQRSGAAAQAGPDPASLGHLRGILQGQVLI